jgi:hypothetical protein
MSISGCDVCKLQWVHTDILGEWIIGERGEIDGMMDGSDGKFVKRRKWLLLGSRLLSALVALFSRFATPTVLFGSPYFLIFLFYMSGLDGAGDTRRVLSLLFLRVCAFFFLLDRGSGGRWRLETEIGRYETRGRWRRTISDSLVNKLKNT